MLRRMMRDWFSLTRGERRGLQVLGLLLILLTAIRSVLPFIIQAEEPVLSDEVRAFISFNDSLLSIQEPVSHQAGIQAGIQTTSLKVNSLAQSVYVPEYPTSGLHIFDPNTAGFEELKKLGIPPGTASTIINFREAGAVYRKDEDLLRVFGMTDELFERLRPYINVSLKPIRFELNQADSTSLMTVYGIGPIMAGRIIAYRDLLGGFHSAWQLDEVYGLESEQRNELSESCYIDGGQILRLDINRLDASELSRHPYLDAYQARAIVSYREYTGEYTDVDEIISNNLLPDSVYLRVSNYLEAAR